MTPVLIYLFVVLSLAFSTTVAAKRWQKAKPGTSLKSVLAPSVGILIVTGVLVAVAIGVSNPEFLKEGTAAKAGRGFNEFLRLEPHDYAGGSTQVSGSSGSENAFAVRDLFRDYTDCVFVRQEGGATFKDAKRSCSAKVAPSAPASTPPSPPSPAPSKKD